MKIAALIAPAGLLLLCASLAALLLRETSRAAQGPPVPAPAALPADASAPPDAPSFVAPPLDDFAEVSARPVFVMTRRPPPAASPPAPVATPHPPAPAPPVSASGITVVGIVGGPGQRLALLRPPNAASVLSLAEGGSVAGWEVERIRADRVVLKWQTTEVEISFPKAGEKTTGTAPARPSLPGTKRP
jgi:hypothetical protein